MDQNELTIRPIVGSEEVGLFCRLPDVLNGELEDDLGNAPMAQAFRRAGYVNFERTISMTWQ